MAAIQRFFRDGQFLFKEGDASNSIFIVKRGTVSIRKMKGNSWVEIAKVYTNEVIGELSFFDRLPRSATAVASNDVEVLELPFHDLDGIYNAVPPYLRTIMSAMADRLRKANEIIRKLQKSMPADPDSATSPQAVMGKPTGT
jgi:CRP-like cAMP-binding protein